MPLAATDRRDKLALGFAESKSHRRTDPWCDTDDAARHGAVALSLVSHVGAEENPRHNKLCYDSPAWRTLCSAVPLCGYQQPENPATIRIARPKSCDIAISGTMARTRGAILSYQGKDAC